MSKKLKLLLLGITIVIAGFFIFVLFSNNPEKRDFYMPMYSYHSAIVEDPANYELEEKGDVILVTNDNLGFSFEIPIDWNITTHYYEEEAISDEGVDGQLIIHPSDWPDSDFYHDAIGSINCAVGIFVSEESYIFSDETELRYEADVMKLYLESDADDWIEADSLGTIIDDKIIKREKREDREPEYRKTILKIDDYYGYGLFLESTGRISELEIPVNNKIYKIVKRFEAGDAEECRDVYHQIIKSISFTKNED